MPLVLIVGWPSTGKTTVARKVLEYLQKQGKRCELVSDEELLRKEGRNRVFRDSKLEKEMRGTLKAAVLRSVRADVVVILDSMNYIKGYRYELYCLSKEHRTTHCILELVMDREKLKARNDQRPDGDRYDGELLQLLIDRYEAPDSRNRWDSPHLSVLDDDVPLQQIENVLFDRLPPAPNLSTQSQPVSSADYLTQMDTKTKQIVQLILKAQDNGFESEVAIPDLRAKMRLQRPVTGIELNRLRRQFISYNRSHPATSEHQIIANFVQFIQSNIRDAV